MIAEFPCERLARQDLLIDGEFEALNEGPKSDLQGDGGRLVPGSRFAQKPRAANELGGGLPKMVQVEIGRIVGMK